MPTITQRELDKLRSKQGVYSQLSKPMKEIKTPAGSTFITKQITMCVRTAFLGYAKAHGCSPNMLETEWSRFNKFLQRQL